MKKYTAKPITAARSKADELREGSFFPEPRENTNYILELLDDGIIDGDSLARDLLEWLSEDEVTEFCRVYGYEHPEPEDDEYDEIEEATSINSSRYVNVMTLSVGDCIKEDDGCYTITDISKGTGGVRKFTFDDGSTAYYDSNDQVLVED